MQGGRNRLQKQMQPKEAQANVRRTKKADFQFGWSGDAYRLQGSKECEAALVHHWYYPGVAA